MSANSRSKTSDFSKLGPQWLASLMTPKVLRITGITDKTRRNWARGNVKKLHPAYVRAVIEATKRG